MKKVFSNRLIIAFLSFVLGGIAFWGAEHNTQFEKHFSHEPVPNDDSLADSRDTLQQMNQLQQRMMKNFGFDDDDENNQLGIDSIFSNGLAVDNSQNFTSREDDKNVYYEITSPKGDLDNVDVKVDRGQVTITGDIKQESKSGNSVSHFSSNFVRSFPAPDNVDAKNFQVDHKAGKVVISFPKLQPGDQPSKTAKPSQEPSDKFSI